MIFFHWKLNYSRRNLDGEVWLLSEEVNAPFWFCYFQATDPSNCSISFQWIAFRNAINQNHLEGHGYKVQCWGSCSYFIAVWIILPRFRVLLDFWYTWKKLWNAMKYSCVCLCGYNQQCWVKILIFLLSSMILTKEFIFMLYCRSYETTVKE